MMTHLHAGLSAETTEKARVELNENPDSLHQDIQQVLGSAQGWVRSIPGAYRFTQGRY